MNLSEEKVRAEDEIGIAQGKRQNSEKVRRQGRGKKMGQAEGAEKDRDDANAETVNGARLNGRDRSALKETTSMRAVLLRAMTKDSPDERKQIKRTVAAGKSHWREKKRGVEKVLLPNYTGARLGDENCCKWPTQIQVCDLNFTVHVYRICH